MYDASLKQWMLRTNDVGAKAIRFVYEHRNSLKEEAVLLENELSFCDGELISCERIIEDQRQIISAKEVRVETAQNIISIKDDDAKRLKRKLLMANIRESLFAAIGVAGIAYGVYITVK